MLDGLPARTVFIMRAYFLTIATLLPALGLFAQSSTQTTLRNPPPAADRVLLITFGIGDKSETEWDGKIEVENGELAQLIGYEMGRGDVIHPPRRWEMSTRPAFAFNRRNHDEDVLEDLAPGAYLTPRFYVYLNGSSATRVNITTAQGNFSFSLAEIPPAGQKTFLEGRAAAADSPYGILIGRGAAGPANERLTDNDFASVTVAGDDTVWVAYSGHSGGSDRVYVDRILPGRSAVRQKRPHAVSPKGGDVYRTAVAEDAEGNIRVIWSEQVKGNWDLYSRAFDGEHWGGIVRLTTAPQPDIHHRAARGPDGRIHVVWQGARGNKFAIFHKSFDAAAGWSEAVRISALDAGNCWEPSVAVTATAMSMSPGINTAKRWATTFIWRAKPEPNGTGRWPLPQPGGSKLTPHLPPTSRIGSGSPGTSRASIGARIGAIRTTFRPMAPGFTIPAISAWRFTRAGGCEPPAQSLEAALPDPGPGNNYYEYPQLAVDGANRVWAFYRLRRPMQHNVYWRTPAHHALWEIYASYYDGDRWSSMMLLPYSTGRNDMRIDVARDAQGKLIAAYPTDRRSFRDFVNMMPDVFAAGMPAVPGQARGHRLTAFRLPPAQPARQPPNRPRREMPATEPCIPTTKRTSRASAATFTRSTASATRSTAATCTGTPRSHGTATTTALPKTPTATRSTPARSTSWPSRNTTSA